MLCRAVQRVIKTAANGKMQLNLIFIGAKSKVPYSTQYKSYNKVTNIATSKTTHKATVFKHRPEIHLTKHMDNISAWSTNMVSLDNSFVNRNMLPYNAKTDRWHSSEILIGALISKISEFVWWIHQWSLNIANVRTDACGIIHTVSAKFNECWQSLGYVIGFETLHQW